MVIRIQKNSVNPTELQKFLISAFPKYRFEIIKENVLKITKRNLFSIYVNIKRNKIIIKKRLASYKLYLLATILLITLGFVFPLFFYFLFIKPSINMLNQEILETIYTFYRNNVLNYSFYDNFHPDSEE